MNLSDSPHREETRSASPKYSPGLVVDTEHVLRELYSPEHVQNGRLSTRSIPIKDLLERGFSVRRIQYFNIEKLRSLIHERLRRPRQAEPNWKSVGVSKIKVATVRALRQAGYPDKQVFLVVDTAEIDSPEHASILIADENATKSRARRLRELLLQILQAGRMSATDAFLDN